MCLHLSFSSTAIENTTVEKPLEAYTTTLHIPRSAHSPRRLLNMKNASDH